MPYADVAVLTTQPFGQAYSYAIPAGMLLAPGDAVLVPFGRQELPGIVVRVGEESAFAGEPRTIVRRLDDAPLLDAAHVELACWIARRYRSTLSAAIALMLPRGARTPEDLAPPAARPEILQLLGGAEEAVRQLAGRAAAGKALRVVAALLDAGGALPLATLRREHGLTPAVERVLTETGLAIRAAGDSVPATPPDGLPGPELTAAQWQAAETIIAAFGREDGAPGTFVLHGVTGSGKTEVYLAAIAAALRRGRGAIVLVPEIALTPQTERRFAERFPGSVAVMHGRLSRNRQRALWHAVRQGQYPIVVGPRSALFAPVARLGLIVVDEEHEPSYKQSEPAPRYHAREAAVELGRLAGAAVVLGSATPDVGTYLRARAGAFRLLELPRRLAASEAGTAEHSLPGIEVVDMARELREGNSHVLSRALDTAIGAALAAGEQALLFLNRRGAAPLLLCRDCGYAPHCRSCAVALVLHTATTSGAPRLMCHHCQRRQRVPERCPQCHGTRLRPVGIGTQRLEEIVRERYPRARVARWDADTAATHAQHLALEQLVASGEADIIVGTQMVAKGHDFGNVSVVGVVSADLSLNVPDFRAAERTFQLLMQVAGRAGRRGQAARVIVQTYAPGHYAVQAAAAGDYAAFYRHEIAFRRELGYPPCGRLARLVFAARNAETAARTANRYAAALRETKLRQGLPGPAIIGPAPCYFARLNDRYRWQILLKGVGIDELLDAAPPPSGWIVDIDPIELL